MTNSNSLFIPRDQSGLTLIKEEYPDLRPSSQMASDEDGHVDISGETTCERQENGWLISLGEEQKSLSASVLARLKQLDNMGQLPSKIQPQIDAKNTIIDNPLF